MKTKKQSSRKPEQLRETGASGASEDVSTASGWITLMIWKSLRQGIGLAGIWTERSGCRVQDECV